MHVYMCTTLHSFILFSLLFRYARELIMIMASGNINLYNNSGKQHGSSLKIKILLISSIHFTTGYMNSKEVYYVKRSKIILSHILYMYIQICLDIYSMLFITVKI